MVITRHTIARSRLPLCWRAVTRFEIIFSVSFVSRERHLQHFRLTAIQWMAMEAIFRTQMQINPFRQKQTENNIEIELVNRYTYIYCCHTLFIRWSHACDKCSAWIRYTTIGDMGTAWLEKLCKATPIHFCMCARKKLRVPSSHPLSNRNR